jgi:hypothetical protein
MFHGKKLSMRALSKFAFILLLLYASQIKVAGQDDGMVKRATAETNDGLHFSLWVKHQVVGLEQDVILYYEVDNRSSRPIYLVLEKPPDIRIEGRTILVASPISTPIGHGEYNYDFIKIDRGKNHSGQLTIPGGKYGEEREWDIEMGFGYVTDATGLNRRLGPTEDPAALRGLLLSRIVVVGLKGVNIRTKSAGDE